MLRFLTALSVATALSLALAPSDASAQKMNWIFMTHAAFYADVTHDANPIDPQVFVRDPNAPAGTGPESITHAAGFRPENQASDDHTSPLYNANGRPLGVNIGKWLNAAGIVDITANGAEDRLHLGFTGLVESRHYSLFRFSLGPPPAIARFTPLDGTATTNTFVATPQGTADLSVDVPVHLTTADRIVLMFNSDGGVHADQPGALGIDSHAQLIMRVRLM